MNIEQRITFDTVKVGFERQSLVIPITSLIPLKPFREAVKKTRKYRQILESIQAIGLVEPPAVLVNPNAEDSYFILDGNCRIEALKDLHVPQVECLVAEDDDTFTYNRRINRITAAQDYRMIVKAVEKGVSEEQIAQTLGVQPSTIRRRAKILVGICDEVREMLAEKPCTMKVFELLKEMLPVRQIEAAELMIGNNNYSVLFARALIAATPPNQLIKKESKQSDQSMHQLMAKQEKELASLQMNIKVIEETFGEDTLLLAVSKGYLKKILTNGRIVYWLSQNHSEYLSEFQAIAEIATLPASVEAASAVAPGGT